MRYLRLTIAYDGRDFVGWQVQSNGRTIQGELEQAWQKFTGESTLILGSGRTDSGVHAVAQMASVATQCSLPLRTICLAMNAHLPPQIAVRNVEEAPEGFNAINDSVSKTYRYWIQTGPVRNPFLLDRCWHITRELDLNRMRQAAAHFVGRQDFASMQSVGSPRKSTVRQVTRLQVESLEVDGFPVVEVQISANGFLYNMVRNIVGTLVDVGRGKIAPDDIPGILLACDRTLAGPTAPAAGLAMLRVEYPF